MPLFLCRFVYSMSHRILQLIVVFIPWMSIAQTFQIDTLFSSYFVSGKLNQLDIQTRKFSSPYLIYNTCDLNNSLLNPSTRFDLTHLKRDVLKFSALPHIGFYYAFGQQGVQDLKAEYQQKISKNWLLNAQVINEQYNGFQRNSALNNLNYEAVAMYEDSLFLSEIKISTFKKTIQWNGGLQTDSLLNDLPQDYIPVNKTAATSQWNTQIIGHKTNVWLNKEKKTSAFILENSINFRRYRYNEVGDIEALYGEVFIDSAETNDSLNIFKNENTLSYKFKKKFFDIQMGALHRYMQSKAFEMNLDTNMIRSFLNFNLQKGVVSFNHKSSYDPIGNFQSWQFQNQLNVDGKSHKISIGNSIKRLPLDFNYRLYNGNSLYYIYHTSELQREDEIFISAYQKIKGLEIFSKAGYRFLGNTYQFIDSGWSNNEIPDFNILYFSISSKYESQKMMVQSTTIKK